MLVDDPIKQGVQFRCIGAKLRICIADARVQIVAVDFHHVTAAVNKWDRTLQGVI